MRSLPENYDVALIDIEGTTTPITFVHDTLFPYVRANMGKVLSEAYDTTAAQDHIRALRKQAEEDVASDRFSEANLIPADGSKQLIVEAVQKSVEWQMAMDRKSTALKALQGWVWQKAYESKEITGVVYADVVRALEHWRETGVKVYIYSSGSVVAQKLLFAHSDHGDLSAVKINSKISFLLVISTLRLEPKPLLIPTAA